MGKSRWLDKPHEVSLWKHLLKPGCPSRDEMKSKQCSLLLPPQTNIKNTSDLENQEDRRSFLKRSRADGDEDPVQGMEMIIFMTLPTERQILKDKPSQHAGPPRAASE